MTARQNMIPNRHTDEADAPGALRSVSPGVIAIALLLALTASVAAGGVTEGSDPARFDRREAPRELTVRWLTDAVARAVRDLASTEAKPGATTLPINAPLTIGASAPMIAATRLRDLPPSKTAPIPDGWPAQGLLNLPPPTAL